MGKQIEITFPNGEVWHLDAQVVMDDRADCFAGIGLPCAEPDESELIAHMQNNMDWTEVMKRARSNGAHFQATYDYAEAFDDARFEVKAGEV